RPRVRPDLRSSSAVADNGCRRMRARVGWVVAAAVLVAAAGPVTPAAAEPFFDLYTGKSKTRDEDLRIRQSAAGNELRFKDVSFDDKSFESPPWYGVRAGYFFEEAPWLGLALEYFHFKMLVDTSETRRLTGTRGGVPVDATARVDSVVQKFQITHGVNYLAVDVLARYGFFEDDEDFPKGRLQLYLGAGAGPVLAHAETRVDGLKDEPGYEVAGVGVQAFVGARFMLLKYLGLFVEGK